MNIYLRAIILPIFLGSCSLIDTQRFAPNYVNAFNSIKDSFYGYDESLISSQLVDQISFASLILKAGKGPEGLLILESIDQNKLTYVSADNIRFALKDGKIIRTSGFDNNLIRVVEPRDALRNFYSSDKIQTRYIAYYSYDEPAVNQMKIEVVLSKIGYEEIAIFEKKIKVFKIKEEVTNSYLGWSRVNTYWVDDKEFFVWKSEQYISPLLPAVSYQITKKPAL